MNKPTISIIAAVSENRALGKNNKLLWHIPEDLKRFKSLTMNHPIIMGRKTFESIGKPLPYRLNIIITKNSSFTPPGWNSFTHKDVVVTHSIQQAIDTAKKHETQEIFIIGGGKIYEQALPLADKLYLTLVNGHFEADTYFPDYSEFDQILSKKESQTEKYQYTFLDLVRTEGAVCMPE